MAGSFTYKKVKYNILSASTASVAASDSHKKLDGDLVIPETIDKNGTTYRVVEMEKECFHSSGIRSVELPKGLESIPSYAFWDCTKLESVVIPDTVKRIGGLAFSGCTELSDITMPDRLDAVGVGVFSDTKYENELLAKNGYSLILGELTKVSPLQKGHFNVPEGTVRIGSKAFVKCREITSVSVPKGVRSIGNIAFKGCKQLKSIVLPETLTTIGKGAFWGTGIESIALPEGMEQIPDYAFTHCSQLRSVSLPDSLVLIGESAFERCFEMQEILLPKQLKTIAPKAFKYCNSLKAVSIPAFVQRIGSFAFLGCVELTDVSVPESVIRGNGVFMDCPFIGKSLPDIPERIELSLVGNPYLFTVYLNVPDNLVDKMSQDKFLDLGEPDRRYHYLLDGDLYDEKGKDCAFSKDIADPEAATYYYNEPFDFEELLRSQPEGTKIVVDKHLIHKASWKYDIKLEGKPFNHHLFMFHRLFSTYHLHKLMGGTPGRHIVFSPEEVFYNEKPCDMEFLSDSGDWDKVCRYVFSDGRIVKQFEYK